MLLRRAQCLDHLRGYVYLDVSLILNMVYQIENVPLVPPAIAMLTMVFVSGERAREGKFLLRDVSD